MPQITRVLVGIVLAIIISPINILAGYGYTFGGLVGGVASVIVIEAKKDSSLVVETNKDGRKSINPENYPSALSLIVSTKAGAFGVFLLVFVWLQIIAALILMLKDSVGITLGVFLGVVSVGSLFIEINGALLTASFGITNIMGSVVAVLIGVVTIFMYKASPARKITTSVP